MPADKKKIAKIKKAILSKEGTFVITNSTNSGKLKTIKTEYSKKEIDVNSLIDR